MAGTDRHGHITTASAAFRRSRGTIGWLFIIAVGIALLGAPGAASMAHAQPTLVIEPGPDTVIGVGGTMRFFAVYYPTGPGSSLPTYLDPATVTWSSSKSWIVKVNAGLGLGKLKGRAVIKAKYQNLVATTPVVVSGKVKSFQVSTPDGRTRPYALYLPPTHKSGAAMPLVLAFHGTGGVGWTTMHFTLLNTVAAKHGFLVAYPDGTSGDGQPTGWNGGGNGGYAADNHVDDVGFTRMLIDDIADRYPVDARRVYATGMSNGAVFAHRLGFELADRIAAIAPVGGAAVPGGDFVPSPPIRPVPVLEFHGTTDENAPYNPFLPWTIDLWLARNQIPESAGVVSYQQGIVTCKRWAAAESEFTLCTAAPPQKIKVDGVLYDGGGHAWPGGAKVSGSWADVPTFDIDASATMWAFFAAYPMPE